MVCFGLSGGNEVFNMKLSLLSFELTNLAKTNLSNRSQLRLYKKQTLNAREKLLRYNCSPSSSKLTPIKKEIEMKWV